MYHKLINNYNFSLKMDLYSPSYYNNNVDNLSTDLKLSKNTASVMIAFLNGLWPDIEHLFSDKESDRIRDEMEMAIKKYQLDSSYEPVMPENAVQKLYQLYETVKEISKTLLHSGKSSNKDRELFKYADVNVPQLAVIFANCEKLKFDRTAILSLTKLIQMNKVDPIFMQLLSAKIDIARRYYRYWMTLPGPKFDFAINSYQAHAFIDSNLEYTSKTNYTLIDLNILNYLIRYQTLKMCSKFNISRANISTSYRLVVLFIIFETNCHNDVDFFEIAVPKDKLNDSRSFYKWCIKSILTKYLREMNEDVRFKNKDIGSFLKHLIAKYQNTINIFEQNIYMPHAVFSDPEYCYYVHYEGSFGGQNCGFNILCSTDIDKFDTTFKKEIISSVEQLHETDIVFNGIIQLESPIIYSLSYTLPIYNIGRIHYEDIEQVIEEKGLKADKKFEKLPHENKINILQQKIIDEIDEPLKKYKKCLPDITMTPKRKLWLHWLDYYDSDGQEIRILSESKDCPFFMLKEEYDNDNLSSQKIIGLQKITMDEPQFI